MKRFAFIIAFLFLAGSVKSQSNNWQGVTPTFLGPVLHGISHIHNIGDSMLLASGNFIYIEDSSNLAMGVAMYKDGKWTGLPELGQNWVRGTVVNGPYDITSWNDLIVFQSYSIDTSSSINGVYKDYNFIKTWDGKSTIDTIGSTNTLRTFLKVLDGELYAHGWFSEISGVEARGLAKWNGENWVSLDNPFCYDVPNIADIYIYDNKLWVGGNFDNVDDAPFSEIAYLDLADSTWHDLEGGIKQDVFSGVGSFIEYQGDLYIGGSFRYDMGNAGHHIMKWDGDGFSDVGGGVFGANYAFNNWAQVKDIEEFDGQLWVVGDFDWVGGIYHPSLGIWNGNEWCTTGDSIWHKAWSIEVFQGELYMLAEGFNDVSNYNIAKWVGGSYRDTCGTWPLSVRDVESSGLSVFPNPASDHLFVDGLANATRYRLFELTGQLVQTGTFQNDEAIELNHLSSGIYLLIIEAEQPQTFRIVKQ